MILSTLQLIGVESGDSRGKAEGACTASTGTEGLTIKGVLCLFGKSEVFREASAHSWTREKKAKIGRESSLSLCPVPRLGEKIRSPFGETPQEEPSRRTAFATKKRSV